MYHFIMSQALYKHLILQMTSKDPRRQEAFFVSCCHMSSFPPRGGKAVSELTKPKPQWVIDSFNGDFILRLLGYHISTGLPHLHNSAE